MITKHILSESKDNLKGTIIVQAETAKELKKKMEWFVQYMGEQYHIARPTDYHIIRLTETSAEIRVHIQPYTWPTRNLMNMIFAL